MRWQAQELFGREESRVFYQDLLNSLGMEVKNGERLEQVPYRAGDETGEFYLGQWSERGRPKVRLPALPAVMTGLAGSPAGIGIKQWVGVRMFG